MEQGYSLEEMADGMLPLFRKLIEEGKPFSFTFTPIPFRGVFEATYAKNSEGYWRPTAIVRVD